MGSVRPAGFHVKSVAVVGAGPSGLAAANYLNAQAAFDRVVVFEQQLEAGGVWNYSPVAPGPLPVPQASPPVFPSPLYDRLHANISKPLMGFSDQPFPSASCVFPFREDIHQYLLRYARHLRALVSFGFLVTNISHLPGPGRDRWRLQARSIVDGRTVDHVFDAVVVANGHYSVLFVPSIPHMAAFRDAHPSVITHAIQYRTADAFRGKKVVVVVGNGPSGIEIALQINKVSEPRTLLSARSPTPPERLAHMGCDEMPEIDAFLVGRRGLRFKDGREETDVDAVVFCTGYLYDFPFLPDLRPDLITDGHGVHGLYKHLFHARHPTLAFVSLLTKSIPWHVAEAQAAALAAVWSGNLALPPPRRCSGGATSCASRKATGLSSFNRVVTMPTSTSSMTG